MDKMRMESVDMTARNIEKIGVLVPNCTTETKDENGKKRKIISFEILRQMLSDDDVKSDEAYEFTWGDKNASIVETNKPIRKTFRPSKDIAKRQPRWAVFCDSSFADSLSKINVGEVFKILSPDTSVKVI